MGKIGLLIIAGAFGGMTIFGFMASSQGWGLAGGLDKPVSIRQQSNNIRHRNRRSGFFIGSRHRRHSRGGFLGGK
ncbi:MAG: hypothetical protein JRF33_19555 [Deltaproteobacteria bacterium]|nr:hypothetical protein [Deltaproteobacteria bacterium]